MQTVSVLLAIPESKRATYYEGLSDDPSLSIHTVHTAESLFEEVRTIEPLDLLIIDSLLDPRTHQIVGDIRRTRPRLIMILIDQSADFGTRGHADALSTDPFQNNELLRVIRRLLNERNTETLQSSAMPAIRDIYRRMRSAVGVAGKRQEAAQCCLEVGFVYAAYYEVVNDDPFHLDLQTQAGPQSLKASAPRSADINGLIGWSAANNQTRIAQAGDTLSHRFITHGRVSSAIAIPVASDHQLYGALIACADAGVTISQDRVMLVELISAQLAAALVHDDMP